jgi:hypothetical protein
MISSRVEIHYYRGGTGDGAVVDGLGQVGLVEAAAVEIAPGMESDRARIWRRFGVVTESKVQYQYLEIDIIVNWDK